ncbi:putative acetyl transferase [Fibrella aestuarina BUZ 2]|uniref:Putative acetyl transferase n=1 Tax=Fibrella aestuarina BUZ 2 TaxID=1166018 RepID=I0K3L9_9BACT|nr:acyltransferase [Fibrella aestuarina]CCG98722.1 putative acetyl transferase [Fibrella aestuarina BUZ 2]
MSIKEYIVQKPALKRFMLYALVHPRKARPRRWVSWFVNPFVHRHHRTAQIQWRARLDVLPFNTFRLGAQSIIEDYCLVNNGVGSVEFGDSCLLGVGSTVIGPVCFGNNVMTAQHVVLSGLNHDYERIDVPIKNQPVSTRPIVVEDDCWIGANAVVVAGVTIGRHSVVAAGSVVTRDVPPFSVVGGNPARLLKQYDEALGRWVSTKGRSDVNAAGSVTTHSQASS